VEVIRDLRPAGSAEFEMPTVCPVCGAKVLREEGESAYRCTSRACPAQLKERLRYLVYALDVEGLGERTVEQLVDRGLVRKSSDFCRLSKHDLLQLEGFAERSTEKLLVAIAAARKPELP